MWKKKSNFFWFFIIIFNLVFFLTVRGEPKRGAPKLVIVNADKKEISGDIFFASGNVEAYWESYRIYADYLEYNRISNELTAEGRITLTSEETALSGERFHFDLKEQSGEMYETYGLLSPTVHYTTDKLIHESKDRMKFKKLNFTPCAQCKPRWKITCSKGKIKKEKYIEMSHLLFKVKDFPVFYWPYMRYPITEDGRATGLLMPQMGNSSTTGFFVLNAFYWAAKPNIDLTLYLDYYAKAGKGFAQEFRYLFPHMAGNIQFYLFNYKKDFTVTDDFVLSKLQWEPRNKDYYFKMKHQQNFSVFKIKNRFVVDIDKQSDPNFQRVLGGDFDTVSNNLYRSAVSWSASYNNLKISMTTSQNDTYSISKNQTTSKRYLPGIEMNVNQQKIGKLPGYFSLAASYASIHKKITELEEVDEETNETIEPEPGIFSGRFNITPSYTLNLIKEPWLSGTVTLKSSFSFYSRSQDPEAEADEIVVLKEPVKLDYQKIQFTLKGPIISRIFDLKRIKFKHLLEPEMVVVYSERPNSENSDQLIVMDSLDRFTSMYSSVQFSLKSRLLYKSKFAGNGGSKKSHSAREILSYTISQKYYLDPRIANRQKIDGVYPQFAELTNTVRFKPVENVSLDTSLNYNHYLNRFVYLKIDLGVHYKDSPVTGTFRYIKRINPFNYEVEKTMESGEIIIEKVWSETIGGGISLDIGNFPIKLDTRLDYDIYDHSFVNGAIGLRIDYQCVTFNAGINVYNYFGETRKRFDFGITFGNLGMVKNMLGRSI